MNVKRFFANSTREALTMVRNALGTDAVILSNRAINGGNEILALGGEDMESLVSSGAEKGYQSKPANTHPSLVKQSKLAQSQTLADFINRSRLSHESAEVASSRPAFREEVPDSAPSMAPEQDQKTQEIASLMDEMRLMRGAIETQLSELVWENVQRRDPTTSVLLRAMLTAGFGPGLSRQLTKKLPANQSHEAAINWAKSILEKNLHTINNDDEILDGGGVFALIGPTGVGKTTTTAKLAARCVMKHGTNKLALITTDAYRIGGHEQLRIYGKILGVMVHAVKDEADLNIALEELKGKHTILIDTVGVNQRDSMVAKQVSMLSGAGTNIKRLLCLSATSTGETLTDVVRAYKGKGLAGCIMTKLDEAATIGSTLDVIIREKLMLYYVANGQRVPEDLHLANSKLLVHHAFKLNMSAPEQFQFRDEELPLLMAHATSTPGRTSFRELSLG